MTDLPTEIDLTAVADSAETVDDESRIIPQPESPVAGSGETSEPGPATESVAERVRRNARARMGRGGTGRAGKSDTNSAGPSGKVSRKSTPTRVTPPKPRSGSLVKPLTRLYVSVGTMVMPFDAHCGRVIIEKSEECAKSLEALAQENEAVRRAIIALTQTSAWGGVLIAHLPILLMVLVHHAPEKVADAVGPMAALVNSGAFDEDTTSDESGDSAA